MLGQISGQFSRIFFFFNYFSADAIFLIIVFAVFFAFGLYFGKGRLISLILSSYIAAPLYKFFPFFDKFLVVTGDNLLVINKIVLLLMFLVPLWIIIDRYIFSETITTGLANSLKTAVLALMVVLIVVTFSYSLINYDVYHNFSDKFDQIFSSTQILFYIELVPLISIAFL